MPSFRTLDDLALMRVEQPVLLGIEEPSTEAAEAPAKFCAFYRPTHRRHSWFWRLAFSLVARRP